MLDPNVKFRDYSSTSNTHELLREYMGTEDFKQSDNTLKKLASTSNDHAINNPSGGGCCTIMCVTEIVYDNPVLNQNNRNGLFPALNFNTDFDKYNFDPKALIRAEREAAGYFPHVNDATQLNFDSILPNEDAVNDGALPEQSHTIWNDSGISLAGAISLLALLVVFESF